MYPFLKRGFLFIIKNFKSNYLNHFINNKIEYISNGSGAFAYGIEFHFTQNHLLHYQLYQHYHLYQPHQLSTNYY